MTTLPELRFLEPLMKESACGVRFEAGLSALVEPLMRELVQGAEGGRRVALFFEIFDRLGRDSARVSLDKSGSLFDPSAYMSSTMNAVLQNIGQNFKRDLKEADLAKLNRQSVSAFSRPFRRHTGLTFVQYVNAMRIELACQHLTQDDLNITDICFEVGFNNLSNFNRQFLLAKGMTPSKFRSLYR